MEIIQGKINSAVSFARQIDDTARKQIQRMCDYDLTAWSKIRIMPDVHAGKGCTIGTTMTITDKAVPNIVGVDIGCGMYTVKLGKEPLDLVAFDEAAHFVPSGMTVWDEPQKAFPFTKLKCFSLLKRLPWLESGLGTLGGGNHFIEIEKGSDGMQYLVIHTGSRNLGKQVAELYQQMAVDQHSVHEPYLEARQHLIEEYKKTGRTQELQTALRALAVQRKEPDMPEDLCYLTGECLENYLHDVELCQQYAKQSRELIAKVLLERTGLKGEGGFHTVHNYIDTKEMILRKGAIAAHQDELVLIPINMKDGSILAKGKGNPEWNYSAPHGAGRIMSRRQAFTKLSLAEYKQAMEGIYSTTVTEETLDEAPMAYKPMEDILSVLKETAEVVDILRPIYNFKAAETILKKEKKSS